MAYNSSSEVLDFETFNELSLEEKVGIEWKLFRTDDPYDGYIFRNKIEWKEMYEKYECQRYNEENDKIYNTFLLLYRFAEDIPSDCWECFNETTDKFMPFFQEHSQPEIINFLIENNVIDVNATFYYWDGDYGTELYLQKDYFLAHICDGDNIDNLKLAYEKGADFTGAFGFNQRYGWDEDEYGECEMRIWQYNDIIRDINYCNNKEAFEIIQDKYDVITDNEALYKIYTDRFKCGNNLKLDSIPDDLKAVANDICEKNKTFNERVDFRTEEEIEFDQTKKCFSAIIDPKDIDLIQQVGLYNKFKELHSEAFTVAIKEFDSSLGYRTRSSLKYWDMLDAFKDELVKPKSERYSYWNDIYERYDNILDPGFEKLITEAKRLKETEKVKTSGDELEF